MPKKNPNETNYDVEKSTGTRASLNTPNFAHMYAITNNKKYLSFKNSGTITFTKVDSIARIYAGTFTIKMKNKDNPNDIIEITEGRFDINIKTLYDIKLIKKNDVK